MFMFRRLQELGRKEDVPLYTCFVDFQKAYESVDRSFLWVVLARFEAPLLMVGIVRQFHDGMRACVRLDRSYPRRARGPAVGLGGNPPTMDEALPGASQQLITNARSLGRRYPPNLPSPG